MPAKPLPRDVRMAIEFLSNDLSRRWKIDELARLCGVPRRTLEKHFKHYLGKAPLQHLQAERLNAVRRRLLRAAPDSNVTHIASDCGFFHLGRFALSYKTRFGESPSETLSRGRNSSEAKPFSFYSPAFWDRPTLAVFPSFDTMTARLSGVVEIGDDIAAALCRTGWIKILASPAARYHLHCKFRQGGHGRLRLRMTLLDQSTSRFIWAEAFDFGASVDLGYINWLSNMAASALRSIVRDAEINRVYGKDPAQLTAWELSMRALPMVIASDPAAQARALELLDHAMELTPRDPVPTALAAWCHGLRAGHHFSDRLKAERDQALRLAVDAGPPAASVRRFTVRT